MPLAKVLLWWLQLMQSPFCLAHLHASAHCALCILSTGGPVEWSSAHTTDLAAPAIMQIKWENSFPISCSRLKLAAQDCLLRSQCLIGNANTRRPSVRPSCHTIGLPECGGTHSHSELGYWHCSSSGRMSLPWLHASACYQSDRLFSIGGLKVFLFY